MTVNKPYKLLVAGSRGFINTTILANEITRLAETELKDYSVSIVSGMARGADRMAYDFAQRNGVLCHEFPADWVTYGKRAGFIRNEQMGDFADGLIAFWDGESRGTQHMINYMQKLRKDIRIVNF